MSTTITTLAGFQELLVASAHAEFATTCMLLNAVDGEAVSDAETTVRFQGIAVPDAAAIVAENTSLSAVACTATAVPAVLATYPLLARVSLLSDGSPRARRYVAQTLGGGIARGVDTAITALFPSFTAQRINVDSGIVSVSDFWDGVATLDATGFTGEKIAVFHPMTWKRIGPGILALAGANGPKTNEFLLTGFIKNVAGTDIYVSPWVSVVNNIAFNAIYMKNAIGLAYRDPIIDIKQALNTQYASMDYLGTAFACAVLATAAAGCKFCDNIIAT